MAGCGDVPMKASEERTIAWQLCLCMASLHERAVFGSQFTIVLIIFFFFLLSNFLPLGISFFLLFSGVCSESFQNLFLICHFF